MDLLILMVERQGELIARAEIIDRLWGKDVFIEVEPAVNTLIRKIRQALQDSSEAPNFVETVPGKGYRFIAPVTLVPPGAAQTTPLPASPPTSSDAVAPAPVTPPVTARRRRLPLIVAGVLLAAIAAVAAWTWNGARPARSRIVLAVLPFQTVRVDSGHAYLAGALHEETIAALGQVDPEHIEVVSRRTLSAGQANRPLAQIAQELGVDYFVASSIDTDNGRVRITSSLLRASDQATVWSRSYENDPRDVLALQRELGAAIAREMRQTLSTARLDALGRRHSADPEAFQLYLQGLAAWNQLTPPESTRRAIEFYQLATARDPGYALPWAGLALAYAGAPINGDADPRHVGPEARRTAERAISADARLAEAQTAMGAVNFWFDWNWASAETMFRNAVATDPTYAFGQRMVGILLSHAARHDEAQEHMRRLLKLEPTYEMNWALRAQVAFNAGEFAAAEEFALQATVFQPDFWIADYQLAMAYERTGKKDLALATLGKHLSARGANSKLRALRGYILGTMGRHDEAREVLQAFELTARDRYVPSYARALVHAGLGDRAAALELLERAVDERDVHLIALPTDAKWNAFRTDARFVALLERCGFSGRRP